MFTSILPDSLSKSVAATILGAVLCAALPATGLAAGATTQAAGDEHLPALFLPAASAKASADTVKSAVRDSQVVRYRQVDVDLPLLTAAADTPAGTDGAAQTIELNLFDDVNFVAVADRVEHGERGIIWTGHLRGVDMSSVVLVINDDIVSGNISMPMARYHIRFAGNGVHEVQRIDQSLFPRDEPFVPIPDLGAKASAATADTAPGAQADDGSIIDVMVIYSATTRSAAGGTNAMKSLIDLAVAETNQSYQNSGVTQRLRLVHAEEVTYKETGDLEDALNCIQSATDGCLDNVHTLRNTYGADLVSFWVENGGDGCGLGYHMDTVSAAFAPYGFSAVARSCATGYYSFGHELGHNMGLMHDVYMDSSTKPYAYAHGYVNTTAGVRTIMAYNNACSDIGKSCTRLQYWSNPAVSYQNTVLGNSSTADDHRALNNTASTVANFRTSVAPPPTTSSTVIEFYNTTLDNYFITANASEASAIDAGSAGPGWSRTGGTFKSGGSTSVCRFYGSLSPGPNSHFYTVDANECAALKAIQASTPDTQKRWNFESLDFLSTPAVNKTCGSGTVPVYRAYNNGFARNVDSNHRITTSLSAIQEVVDRGWSNEGVVMCAPS